MRVRERRLVLPHLGLAAREWGEPGARPVLALHGWLDNAASFDRLAPALGAIHLVAIDLAGHGHSDHRPPGASVHFIDWPPDVAAAADVLGWQSFALIGHSMGAGISCLMPGAYPDRIERMVLIEGAGPLSSRPQRAPERLAEALAEERSQAEAEVRPFADLDQAIRARANGTELDRESARILVERALGSGADGVHFRHDPRLKLRSRLRLTEEQVRAFLAAIDCPVLAIRATQGWPFPAELVQERLGLIRDLRTIEVEGGHHVHLTHPERVAPHIRAFFEE